MKIDRRPAGMYFSSESLFIQIIEFLSGSYLSLFYIEWRGYEIGWKAALLWKAVQTNNWLSLNPETIKYKNTWGS